MFAVIAAILFAVALLLDLFNAAPNEILNVQTLSLAGFLCVALHLAGAGTWHTRVGSYRRGRGRR